MPKNLKTKNESALLVTPTPLYGALLSKASLALRSVGALKSKGEARAPITSTVTEPQADPVRYLALYIINIRIALKNEST